MHQYEETQQFNLITKFLHSVRYSNLELIVKDIVPSTGILKVVDIGCGTGKSYSVLKSLDIDFQYVGIELRRDFVEVAQQRYGAFANFEIICDSVENVTHLFQGADLIIALETFEHIPAKTVVRVIEAIGQSKFKHLYVTVPNEIGPAILLKNVGSALMGYRRHKYYTWKETVFASLYNFDKVRRHTNGHRGFDWRWLGQTIRQNCVITRITTSPINLIPKCISPSIGFICRSDS